LKLETIASASKTAQRLKQKKRKNPLDPKNNFRNITKRRINSRWKSRVKSQRKSTSSIRFGSDGLLYHANLWYVDPKPRSRATHSGSGQNLTQKKVPRERCRVIIKDKYPAYVNAQTFEKIQAMLRDNYAEYDQTKRAACPTMAKHSYTGSYIAGNAVTKWSCNTNGDRYIGNTYVSDTARRSVSTYRPGPSITKPRPRSSRRSVPPNSSTTRHHRQTEVATGGAQAQQVERLRYHAALAEWQFEQVDPDNRLVASPLESRWEEPLHFDSS
jgi:hypothetical protein